MACPACNSTKNRPYRRERFAQIYECRTCGAIHGTCYLGESYEIVRPYMTDKAVPPEKTRYFDFITLGSKGVDRRHGWYDPETRLVVQIG
jgi:hypothetical protein